MECKLRNKRIWVAGHNGMVGRALVKVLQRYDVEILTVSRQELDLTHQDNVARWMRANQPNIILLAAAKVGGIAVNKDQPADFLYDNMMMAANIIHEAYRQDVQQLVYFGSSCIYPKNAPQPITEDSLLTSPLEDSNEGYALAKITGVKLCEYYKRQYGRNFWSVMPCNLYGAYDRFDTYASHVIPAMLMKFHEAKAMSMMGGASSVTLWGTGTPLREFLYVDDLARGVIEIMQKKHDYTMVNLGSGMEISILDLAHKIATVTAYEGEIKWNSDMPDGTPRKVMDSSRFYALAGQDFSLTPLDKGLELAYQYYLKTLTELERRHAAA